ncbi:MULTISPECIES: endolytic transglycosylase MltG [Arthrobacter]|uniref:Endolytic murein transglycosylase n=2 Tax=Arthrobacter TaxID=1663 RepID=A0ABU9KGW3_9MICC|nr:endolytic transglycosylase MltG [Arthrobacter sp. YJM1]MDP5226058.1 endolytic transglycosylase MltG [Arthrobacter sp. YJM1]
MSTHDNGAGGMPLTRRELRALERIRSERAETDGSAAPFDQELAELPRRRDVIERFPLTDDDDDDDLTTPEEAPTPAPEPAQAQPAARLVEPEAEPPAAGTSAREPEPMTSRIAPVPATAHAQHFYPEPETGRLHALAHGHRGSAHPLQRGETKPVSQPTVVVPVVEPVQDPAHETGTAHETHAEGPGHAFPFAEGPEQAHAAAEPFRTAFQEETTSHGRHRRVRGWVAVLLSLVLVGGGGFAAAQFVGPLLGWNLVTDYPGPGQGSVSVQVQDGSSLTQVANTLKDDGIVADAGTFTRAFSAAGITLSPGTYTFRKEMRSSDAVAVFAASGSDKVSYVPLSAGLRIGESLDAIAKGTGLKVEDLQALSDKPAQFGVSAKAKNLEGYLFPGEYRFPVGASAKDVLAGLVKATQDELKGQGITDPDQQYRILTIASIVQAEAGRADYPTVAGAIMNRLQPNAQTLGYIQSDATVTYGLGRKSYELTAAEKADKSNPYNTYANQGLPVGPIGSPGKLAIDGAAHPKASDYLYWVTINLDTGETRFAATLEEHNKNVALYQQWCSANAGRCQ